MSGSLLLGAVAYDPKVVTIWEGFRAWLRARDFDMDFVLYSHYERQVEDLLDGRIGVAWNSPLAWVRARRMALSRNLEVRAIAMRDTDRDLVSVIAVRNESPFTTVSDLGGHVVGAGAVDSPQATLLPMSLLRDQADDDSCGVRVQRFDVGVGLHGDHIGGERDAAIALRDGRLDAACMTDSNLLLFGREGTFAPGSMRVIAQTPPYDHCNMTAGPSVGLEVADAFVELLISMSYAEAEARVLLDLEGLSRWLPGRTTGYEALEQAVDETGFYDQSGAISAGDYRP